MQMLAVWLPCGSCLAFATRTCTYFSSCHFFCLCNVLVAVGLRERNRHTGLHQLVLASGPIAFSCKTLFYPAALPNSAAPVRNDFTSMLASSSSCRPCAAAPCSLLQTNAHVSRAVPYARITMPVIFTAAETVARGGRHGVLVARSSSNSSTAPQEPQPKEEPSAAPADVQLTEEQLAVRWTYGASMPCATVCMHSHSMHAQQGGKMAWKGSELCDCA